MGTPSVPHSITTSADFLMFELPPSSLATQNANHRISNSEFLQGLFGYKRRYVTCFVQSRMLSGDVAEDLPHEDNAIRTKR